LHIDAYFPKVLRTVSCPSVTSDLAMFDHLITHVIENTPRLLEFEEWQLVSIAEGLRHINTGQRLDEVWCQQMHGHTFTGATETVGTDDQEGRGDPRQVGVDKMVDFATQCGHSPNPIQPRSYLTWEDSRALAALGNAVATTSLRDRKATPPKHPMGPICSTL
jgi:hypothetical protein